MDMETLRVRLASAEVGVRRVAVHDLVRVSAEQPDAFAVLTEHLMRETDGKPALTIIRHLGAAGHQEARPVLWRLYMDPGTPARVAHAAINAHDDLEWLKRGGASTLESARGKTPSAPHHPHQPQHTRHPHCLPHDTRADADAKQDQ
jgi:hypothetical protein